MSSADLDPINNPEAWDKITIGGVLSPGICKVSGFKRKHDFDRKKGKGASGETLTFVQKPAAEGSIKFLLFESIHFLEWQKFRDALKYDPTKRAVSPVDIYYPALDDLGIKAVVTSSIGMVEPEGKGLYSITVEFIEYNPPPPVSAVSTPKGSKPGDVFGPPPLDPQEMRIEALNQSISDFSPKDKK